MVARPSDIIVVGAGIVGCAVAYELARRGASVEIVDERPAGMGATQASAGVLAPYIEAREGSPLLDLTVRSLDLYDAFIGHVCEDSGAVIPYRRTGTIDLAATERELDTLRVTANVLAKRNVPALLLDETLARSEEPLAAGDIVGALLIEAHGYVGANELTRALVAAARRYGAQVVEPSRVRRIRQRDGDMIVDTDRGTLTSNAVVLAAGCWSGAVEIDGVSERVPVRPIRGQLLYLGWSGPPLRRVTWSSRCYIVPWPDGTVLVGATSEDAGFDERLTVSGVHDLLEAACDLIPHAWSATFRGGRVGLRPASRDNLPVIGASATIPNLIYATGHYRNGVLLAPLTAQLVADAIVDERVDAMLQAVSPSRFGAL
jgi:glycine oxidase